MAILVTGVTGLVGSRLLRRFVETGADCRALVRAGKQIPHGATQVEGDLFDEESLKRAVEGVTAIVHLAAVFRTKNQDEVWRANLDGTRNLIASTGLVYNEDASRLGMEDDEVNPKLAYPASKVAAEKELRSSGLTWSILRLTFVYGDGDEHLASTAKAAAAMKMHPAQAYSMIHQWDVATAFELALSGALDGLTLNVADDAPTTIYEMASLVGFTLDPSNEPLKNPWWGRVDASRIRSLGFTPKILTVHQAAREGIL